MKMNYLFALAFALAAPATTGGASEISVQGAVDHPGTLKLPASARLADAIIAAAPRHDAYLLGTRFNRDAAKQLQRRLKAGLLHDLGVLERHESVSVQETAEQLATWLEQRPVTGRVVQSIDVHLMQVQPRNNPEVQDGDSVIFTTRPATVNVVGAVSAPCALAHEARKGALQYVTECAARPTRDPDNIYVIQADGLITKLGVAAWNRADPQAVSPGGTIYVPVAAGALQGIDQDFNEEFAAFIATQPINP